jgi:hypothetical protein
MLGLRVRQVKEDKEVCLADQDRAWKGQEVKKLILFENCGQGY